MECIKNTTKDKELLNFLVEKIIIRNANGRRINDDNGFGWIDFNENVKNMWWHTYARTLGNQVAEGMVVRHGRGL